MTGSNSQRSQREALALTVNEIVAHFVQGHREHRDVNLSRLKSVVSYHGMSFREEKRVRYDTLLLLEALQHLSVTRLGSLLNEGCYEEMIDLEMLLFCKQVQFYSIPAKHLIDHIPSLSVANHIVSFG
ncbi:hypothetical protein GCK32_016477 [Trichostrongylus colubriformis]|uniref:Uncharacterized protein n=1 Tax=Trichostrongylus colubriformis TaxID=6319 RepID=A0AAN8F5P8_TRICO